MLHVRRSTQAAGSLSRLSVPGRSVEFGLHSVRYAVTDRQEVGL